MYQIYVTSSFSSYIESFKVRPICRPVCRMFLQYRVCVIENTHIFVFVGFRVGRSVILRSIIYVEGGITLSMFSLF